MDCHACPDWKDDGCEKRHPADLPIQCLLKMQIWMMFNIYNALDEEVEEIEEGDWWKNKS